MDEATKICKLCESSGALYTCPRCFIHYCSSKCYQSSKHLHCSEQFYKAQVKEQLMNGKASKESTLKMKSILEKFEEQRFCEELDPLEFCNQYDGDANKSENDEDDELDSDDDEDLTTRMKGVDLDDSEAVWNRLTDTERQQFQQLVISGDIASVIPVYIPWWLQTTDAAPEITVLSEIEANVSNKVSGHQNPDSQNSTSGLVSGTECVGALDEAKCNLDENKSEIACVACRAPDNRCTGLLIKSSAEHVSNCKNQHSFIPFGNVPGSVRKKYEYIHQPVPLVPLSSLCKHPSPLLRFSVLNVAASYAWIVRLFNGEHLDCCTEATEGLLTLSGVLSSQDVFQSAELAISSIRIRSLQHQWLCTDSLFSSVQSDALHLLTCPPSAAGYFLHAALADVCDILRATLTHTASTSEDFLSSILGNRSTISIRHCLPLEVKKSLKKVEFLMSYAYEHRFEIQQEFLPLFSIVLTLEKQSIG